MLALIRGAGDLATGIALRLWPSGIRVVLTDLERPTAIRRTVAFSEAIVYGETTVEDVTARLAANADEARALLAQGIVPVLADPGCACREALAPDALVDAILAKRKKLGMQQVAPFVNLGLTLTHGLVPPTPGILAVSILLGADIAFVNGGGVRDNIKVGDITYGDIIKVHPFGNEACLVEVTGQQIKDALELGSAAYPGESGGFLQVSGLTYTINADIPSSVVKNDKSEFVKVDGAYRVSDIMVGGQPLDVNKTYTLASHNYMLKDAGDGYTMFGTKNVKLLKDGVMIDNQVLINYIVNNLGGVVGEQYAAPQGRITIKTAASDVPTNESDKVIAGRDTTVTEGDTYTVVAGDCLWNIAYKLYGTGTLYTKLAEANKLADPYIIYIGQILTVPAK